MPLGSSAKFYVNEGDIDRNGLVATESGWYYKWFRGLHLLCGDEGIREYMHRPSWEDVMGGKWVL